MKSDWFSECKKVYNLDQLHTIFMDLTSFGSIGRQKLPQKNLNLNILWVGIDTENKQFYEIICAYQNCYQRVKGTGSRFINS